MEISILTALYGVFKDIISFIRRKKQERDPVKVLEIRHKWKSEFEDHLRKTGDAPIYGEAIIRDISRMDSYPNLDEKEKGISPWFKVEIKGLYHRGLEVFLCIESLKYLEEVEGWRYAHHKEEGVIHGYLVARIPFEAIKSVEWDGDEFYRMPHIYCEFKRRNKSPYEQLIYCRKHGSSGDEYFVEIARHDEVLSLSKKFPKPSID